MNTQLFSVVHLCWKHLRFFCILWMVARLTSPVFLCVLCSHNVVLLRCNHLLPLNLLNKVNGTQLNVRNCMSWVVSPSSKYSKAPWSLSREYFEEQKLTEVASTWLAHRSARRDISSALCEWKLLPISTRVIFVRIPGICTLHIVQDINICTFHQVHIIMIPKICARHVKISTPFWQAKNICTCSQGSYRHSPSDPQICAKYVNLFLASENLCTHTPPPTYPLLQFFMDS